MIKKIIKLGALLVTATLITATAALSNIAYADPEADRERDLGQLMQALGDVTPCINENSTDADKIITIIEEPLGSGPAEVGDTEVRPCFRNTFQYMDGRESHTLTLLAKKVGNTGCSSNAKELVATLDEFSPRFSCTEVQVLLSTGGTSLIYSYIGIIYRWGASMVGIVAVLIIVLSGIQISAAGGDPEAITKAKTRILQSIAGIVVLFLSGLILYTINPNFFVAARSSPEAPEEEEADAEAPAESP